MLQLRLPILLLLFSGCGGASALLTQATEKIQAADAALSRGAYADAVSGHDAARRLLDRLHSDFPGSSQAREVDARTASLGAYTVEHWQDRVVPEAELAMRALSDPSAAAVWIGNRIKDQRTRDDTLLEVARALGAAKNPLAVVAAERLFDPAKRAIALMSAAGANPRTIIEKAARAANEVLSVQARWETLGYVARALILTGKFKLAVDVARRIPDPHWRAQSLIQTGFGLAASDRGDEATTVLEEALEASKAISDGHHQAQAFVAMADVYGRGGARDGALSLYARALDLARALPISQQESVVVGVVTGVAGLDPDKALDAVTVAPSSSGRADALEGMAKSLSEFKVAGAAAALLGAGALAKTLDGRDRDRAVLALADTLSTLDAGLAQGLASSAGSPETRAAVLLKAAQTGRTPQAFRRAVEAARAIFDDASRGAVLAACAASMGRAGLMDLASSVLSEAWKIAGSGDAPARVRRLAAMAETLLRVGQKGPGTAALGRAVDEAAKITETLTRASELSQLASLYAANDRDGEASRVILLAVEAAMSLEFEGTRARILNGLAQLLAQGGPVDPKPLGPLLKAAMAIQDADRRTPILEKLSPILTAHGRLEEALQAAGAVASPSERFGLLAEIAVAAARVNPQRAVALLEQQVTSDSARASALARMTFKGQDLTALVTPGGAR